MLVIVLLVINDDVTTIDVLVITFQIRIIITIFVIVITSQIRTVIMLHVLVITVCSDYSDNYVEVNVDDARCKW